ncbi:MAG: hypothetical protein E2O79_01785 [Caldithrix sp.]|nr:MAG: hypothetical protein E2O79_01785 [Caldithrix sp.]
MKYCLVFIAFFLSICFAQSSFSHPNERSEVGIYKNKFIWTGTGQAFVPNYIMIGMLASNLDEITEENLEKFIDEFMHGHGFTGVHVPVSGQWFHIGEKRVTKNDAEPDIRTYDKLAMIIQKVYEAGGCTHVWLWGDNERGQTAKSTLDGIMGRQEKRVLDMIAQKLGPLKGWTMGYGFDLWEWVNAQQLKEWHDYMRSKPGWNHLLGARSSKNQLNQMYEGLDYSSYEYHKPWYSELVKMINQRASKPSFSEDRYRIRRKSRYPYKDYNEDETRRGLWHHTMAGGIAAIWGNLDDNGIYSNKDALKSFSSFWNDKKRFKKDMIIDNKLTDGYCLRASDQHYVFYKEDCDKLKYSFGGTPKNVIALDTRKKYKEIELGMKETGNYVFNAPYISDWAIAVEKKPSNKE